MKPRERKLLLVFLGLLIVCCGWLAYSKLSGWSKRLDNEAHTLDLQEIRQTALLEEKDLWLKRENQSLRLPAFTSIGEADNQLRSFVEMTARASGLKVVERPTLPAKEAEYSHESGIEMTANGEFESVVRFLHSIQQPSRFIEMRKMKLLAGEESPSYLTVEMTLVRHYHLGQAPGPGPIAR